MQYPSNSVKYYTTLGRRIIEAAAPLRKANGLTRETLTQIHNKCRQIAWVRAGSDVMVWRL